MRGVEFSSEYEQACVRVRARVASCHNHDDNDNDNNGNKHGALSTYTHAYIQHICRCGGREWSTSPSPPPRFLSLLIPLIKSKPANRTPPSRTPSPHSSPAPRQAWS